MVKRRQFYRSYRYLFYKLTIFISHQKVNNKRPIMVAFEVQKFPLYFRTAPVITGLSDIISFTTRTGTQQGVRSHVFRVETHRELAAWVKRIVTTTYEACAETNQVSCRKLSSVNFFLAGFRPWRVVSKHIRHSSLSLMCILFNNSPPSLIVRSL